MGWVAIYLKSNELLKKQIFINDWVIDVFLTKSEKAYIYRKGRMIERMGARKAAKFAYRFFSPYVDYQKLHIRNDSKERPSLTKDDLSIDEIRVSLSHTKKYSGAMIVKI